MIELVFTPGGLGGGNGPFWFAMKTGLFEEFGVKVTAREIPGGSQAMVRALLDGEIQLGTVPAPAVIYANLDGNELASVMGLMNKLGFQIMVQPEIRTVEQLRGRTLACSPGSTDAILWQWFLPQHGLTPGVDVKLREIPDNREQMEALRRREIDGMTLSPAGSTYLEKEGFNTLVDFSKQDVDFQLGTIATSRRYAREHSEETQAFLRGLVAAMRRYKRERELALEVLAGYTHIQDQDVLAITYETFTRKFPDWPYPSPKGFQTILTAMAELDPRAKDHAPEEFIDASFLDRLKAEGFSAGLSPG